MAKIYEWSYKEQKGQIVADNVKEAKRQVANKFGNAIKIPRGTSIKKIGLAKGKPPAKLETAADVPKEVRKVVVDSLPDGTVLTGPGGKTYTVGQKGKKPFWYQEAILKHQGIKGVKADTSVSKAFNEDVGDAPELRHGGIELTNALVLQRESHITGSVSMIYEIPGNGKNMCFVSDEAELILPAKTKVWKVGGEWSIT
jgi:hypothetical protein